MKKVISVTINKIIDDTADLSDYGHYVNEPQKGDCFRHNALRNEYKYFRPANPEYRWEDFRRCEAYNNQEWYMTGIQAVAEIATSEDGNTWFSQTIHSPGQWGIESDSSQEYKDTIKDDELIELKSILIELGFGFPNGALPIDIALMFDNAEWIEA